MKSRLYWFPTSRPKQLIMFTNVKAKIGGYAAILPLAAAKVTRIELICDIFIALFNYVEQTRATAEQLTEFQALIETAAGNTPGKPAPDAPVFQPLNLPAGAFVGIFEEFKDLVEDIKAADNYTRGIGEDLMIVAPEGTSTPDADIAASIQPQATGSNYKVNIKGSLQGQSAIRVEYYRKGAGVPQSFFFTKLPGEITIVPHTPGEPESGSLRAILLRNNQEIGQWSPDYPVTVS